MQAESISTDDFEALNAESFIPVEFFFCDSSQQSHSQDALSIVELGKQLLDSASHGDTDVVRDLMCKGAPFTTDNYGTSALHFAARHNHVETAEVLLRAGISKDARTKVDRTPLHIAAYEGHDEMARLLLNYGAEVNSRDMLKMTPLHWAVEREHMAVIDILLHYKADPEAVSKFDKTPLTLALEHNRLDLVDILQQRLLLNIQTLQESTTNCPEIQEDTTSNLIQIEAERQEQQQQFELQQQFQQQKRKIPQVVPVQASKKQKMVFQQIQVSVSSDDEHDKETELAERISSIENSTFKKHKNITGFSGLEQPLRFLQAHGIKMIPVDNDAGIVENAMESGRTVVLTEAGKLALNLTRTAPLHAKRIQMGSRKGVPRKVITIRADQLVGQNSPVLTSRGPNILKRSTAVENKSGKLFLTPVSNNTTLTTKGVVKKKVAVSSSKEPLVLHLDDDIEEITDEGNSTEETTEPVMDIVTLNKQLIEARRLAAEYRKQLQMKEEEAENYKQQLKNIAQKAQFKYQQKIDSQTIYTD